MKSTLFLPNGNIPLDGKRAGKYLQDPMIVLQDGEIILAATVNNKDWNSIMSLHFEPKLQSGKLDMRAASVMAGMLPVPKSYFSSYVEKFTGILEKKLPAMRHDAEIGPRLGQFRCRRCGHERAADSHAEG